MYLIALRTGKILEASNMDLESVNVESCLGCKLLIAVWTFSNIGWNAEDWLGLCLFGLRRLFDCLCWRER